MQNGALPQVTVGTRLLNQPQHVALCGKAIAVPELSRTTEDDLIRIPEAHTGCRCRQDAEAPAGRPGSDVICLDHDDFATRARELDRGNHAGNTRTHDYGVGRVGKRSIGGVVDVFPPAGEGMRQGLSLGV